MNSHIRRLSVGQTLRFEGETWTLIRLDNLAASLLSARGETRMIAIDDLVERLTFGHSAAERALEPLDAQAPWMGEFLASWSPQTIQDCGTAFGLSDAAIAEISRRAGLASRFLTGFEFGYQRHVDEQPDPELGPGSGTIQQRLHHLGKALGMTPRRARDVVERFEARGITGLINRKHFQQKSPLANCPPKVRDALQWVLENESPKSGTPLPTKTIINLVALRLEDIAATAGEPPAKMPGKSAMYEYVALMRGHRKQWQATKTQRGNASRHKSNPSVQRPAAPFDVVVIDSTPLDLFALDPNTGQPVRLWLLLAIDQFSRSIVCFRVTPESEKAVDLSFLLFDIMRPRVAPKEWGPQARWRYGVPAALVFNEESLADADLLGVPAGRPRSILVDHGKVMISHTALHACRLLGTDVQLARKASGADKGEGERPFGRIATDFASYFRSYAGPRPDRRGSKAHVEDRAYWFIEQVQAFGEEWVARHYQNEPHHGLSHPYAKNMRLTPNEMVDAGWAAAGAIPVLADASVLLSLLPQEMRTLHHYGFDLGGLRYNSGALNEYREDGVVSPYDPIKNKWPTRYDPRDLSRIWFWACDLTDPSRGRWIELPCNALDGKVAFSERLLNYVKELIRSRGGSRRASHIELDKELLDLLRRIRDHGPQDERERRIYASSLAMQEAAARDYGRYLAAVDHDTSALDDGDDLFPRPALPDEDDLYDFIEDHDPFEATDSQQEAS